MSRPVYGFRRFACLVLSLALIAVPATAQSGREYRNDALGCSFSVPNDDWKPQKQISLTFVSDALIEYVNPGIFASISFSHSTILRSFANAAENLQSMAKNHSVRNWLVRERPITINGLEGHLREIGYMNRNGAVYGGAIVILEHGNTQFFFVMLAPDGDFRGAMHEFMQTVGTFRVKTH